MMKNKKYNGQIMIEIIVALGVFALLASALTTLIFSSSAGLWVGDMEAQATATLRQAVEELRQTKIGAWNEVGVGTSTDMLVSGDWVATSSTSAQEYGQLVKTITIADVCRNNNVIVACISGDADVYTKQAVVTISFMTRTGIAREMSAEVILTNWDSVDWIQTSWLGGEGNDIWSNATKYAFDDGGIEIDEFGRVRLARAPAICQGYAWDFDVVDDYQINEFTDVLNGQVTVKVIEDESVHTTALYHFDEANGMLSDSSGRNNHLTVFGAPTYLQPGIFQSSVLFDRTGNDYANVLDTPSSGLDGMGQLTIDTWVKRTTVLSADAIIVQKWINNNNRSYSLKINRLGSVLFSISTNGKAAVLASTPTGAVPINTWVHVAAVYDGAVIRIYINGQQQGSSISASGNIFDGNSYFQVGISGTASLNGFIDELRISDIARWTANFTPNTSVYGGSVVTSSGNNTAQIQPNLSFLNNAVSQWYSFTESAQKNSGTITYQLSSDNGINWKYWNGSAWVVATTETQTNEADIISTNIWSFPVSSKQIIFRSFITGDAILDSVGIDCSTLQAEAGDITLNGNGTTPLIFSNRYARPVVIISQKQSGISTVPIVEIASSTGALISLQTLNNGSAVDTQAQYFVIEEGVWTLSGILMEARRTTSTLITNIDTPITTFKQMFSSAPIVLAQRMSKNDTGFVSAEVTGDTILETPTNDSARIGLFGYGVSEFHPDEMVGWVAIEQNRSTMISRAQIRTGSASVNGVSSGCTNVTLSPALTEAPNSLAMAQARLSNSSGWSVGCGESTTTTIGLHIDGDQNIQNVPVGFIAFSKPFRYTEALTQSVGYVGRGSLTSSAFPFLDNSPVQIFDMNAITPSCAPACRVSGYIRVSTDNATPDNWSAWYGPVTTTQPVLLPTLLNGYRWVQYRADLFGDGLQTPVLEATSINYK